MFVSRLSLHVLPGNTDAVEHKLQELQEMVRAAGGSNCRVLHAHFASDDAPDVVFEQTAEDIASLEREIAEVASTDEFRTWSAQMSPLLAQIPKRTVYRVVAAE